MPRASRQRLDRRDIRAGIPRTRPPVPDRPRPCTAASAQGRPRARRRESVPPGSFDGSIPAGRRGKEPASRRRGAREAGPRHLDRRSRSPWPATRPVSQGAGPAGIRSGGARNSPAAEPRPTRKTCGAPPPPSPGADPSGGPAGETAGASAASSIRRRPAALRPRPTRTGLPRRRPCDHRRARHRRSAACQRGQMRPRPRRPRSPSRSLGRAPASEC